ncbi:MULTISPECIES: colicin transporter [Bifidobacterium]|uniref:colicin transporter n=1 Tax=Bifidobacterium TaxID=1678 RepID=UPI0026470CDE|nr:MULTISPECIES: colicin transporter [Bifidobacterium]MDN5978662.1 colicin transporter [Bifidobacterium mongoliense]MDN6016742.1 colicin transporter [Bifidobacterium mongoliense]MDN6467716.1 colicin transporter [Bifidobacterium crudilactis]MDN6558723.1 colicin transporter [Bifidobacterium crudilactis]MDN6772648.1 colicin transporter [Bifidobacterium crudilactis]
MKDINEVKEPEASVEQDEDAATERESGTTHTRRGLWIVIAAIVVVALVVGGVWGWNLHRSRLLDEARTGCAQASDVLRVGMNRYSTLLDGDAATAGEVPAKQVLDTKTLDALKSATAAKEPPLVSCTATDTDGLDRAMKGIDRNSKWYAVHTKSLNAAVKAVNDSKAAKSLADARTGLKGSLDQAKTLLASSDGKVADNATREALSTAIDKAGQVYDAKDVRNPQAYRDAKDRLDKAMKAVDDSMTRKQADDEAAAAAVAAAQSQAAQQQQSYSQSYTPSYGGSGATRQQQTTPVQPSTPSMSSTGNGSTGSGGGTGIDLTPGDRLPGDGNCIVFGDCG